MTNSQTRKPCLFLVLGDQLHPDPHPLLSHATPCDFVLMAEVPHESTHVWSHKARIALFFSAMRHFAERHQASGRPIEYWRIGSHNASSLPEAAGLFLEAHPEIETLCILEPGDARVANDLQQCAYQLKRRLKQLPDPHFLCTGNEFQTWAVASDKAGRDSLRMEFFYRWIRKRTGYLMQNGQPVGGQWNYDAENRSGFGTAGPPTIPRPPIFQPDQITQDVCADVERFFGQHPGALEGFNWPVTPAQALFALEDFVTHRLPGFGQWQDAMWRDEPFLWHSLLSAALNLKLLDPRVVLDRAEAAYHDGSAPLPAVEGFIRQILGWREYVRGIYWRYADQWSTFNALNAQRALPEWFWSGDTQARCMRDAIHQTLSTGYAHHIQRLMVTGNFALLAGLAPRAVADWYLAVYVDAVAWVEEPNTLGMALFALGGRMTSKPYIASGAYIKRMSNYCKGCIYRPEVRSGPEACPFTTLYWDFLMRHAGLLRKNPRMALAYKNLDRMPETDRDAIRVWAIERLEQIESI